MRNKKICAFTLSELMVTLALTSLLVGFCYTGFNYTQKLLYQFNEQSDFLTQLTELNKRSFVFKNQVCIITKESDQKFRIKNDSVNYSLDFRSRYLLVGRNSATDTFMLETTEIKTSFEVLNNPVWKDKLVNGIEFDVIFQKQKFHLGFRTSYDSYTKLNLETQSEN